MVLIQDCLSHLTLYGSCSCYSLANYRTLLSKINHLRADEKTIVSLQQQSIQLLRRAFLLLSNCAHQNQHSHHDTLTADNTQFWSYLSNHLFQRSSNYALKLAQAFPDLIQCCSVADKQLALKYCIRPSLEHYAATPSKSNVNNIEMIQRLVQSLPNLLLDVTMDAPLSSFPDTLITLSSLLPSLLTHTLPVLGCLLTTASNQLTLDVSESFIQWTIRLTNAWTLSDDGTDNLCHMLIILIQKCVTFQQAFYAHLCHLRLFEQFELMLTSKSTIQPSVIACTLVAVSYHTKSNDENFNYKLTLERIRTYSENNRYNSSWFELLVRLSLSQQYQDKRTRWKSSTLRKTSSSAATNDDDAASSSSSVSDDDSEHRIDAEDVYQADVESLSDDRPTETVTQQNQMSYSNLILFPELVLLGLEIAWQNVDNEWSDQQATNKTSVYVSALGI